MIEAMKKDRGVSKARAVCDDCGKDEVVAADVDTVKGVNHVNEGQVTRKLSNQGWALVKGKLRCPMCEAKRKTKEPKGTGDMAIDLTKAAKAEAAKGDLREASPRQKREIIGILELVYDDEAKRFKDGESDKTVADAVGGGVLWGWVAAIREDLFGPDTRNQEMDAIRAEIRKVEGQLGAALGEVRKVESILNDLQARLDKVA